MDDRDLRILFAHIMEKQELDSEQLRDLAKKLDELRTKDIPKLREDIIALKTRSGMWGAAAGCFPVALHLLMQYLTG